MNASSIDYESLITVGEAYKVALRFLNAYWEKGHKSDDNLAVLLSNMSLTKIGRSADPAQLKDWMNSVEAVLQGESDKRPLQ